MSLRYLTTETMLHLTQGWLDPQGGLPILEKHDLTRGLLDRLRSNRTAMMTASRLSNEWEQQLEALSKEQAVLDQAHDQQVRGMYLILSAMAELAEDSTMATELLELRDWLFPQGLELIRKSYVEESGHSGHIEEELSPERRKKLKTIGWKFSKYETNLLQEVDRWLDAGRELGKKENEKLQVQSQREENKDQNISPSINLVRKEWVRLTQALRSNLELLEDISNSERKIVLGMLDKQEQDSDKRIAKRRSKHIPTEVPTPTEPLPELDTEQDTDPALEPMNA
jgi:predicted DNA-binding protein